MPLVSDSDIARVLASTRSIALVGASHKPARPSHRVMQFLLEQGYEVYPVNPGLAGQLLLGRTVYPDLDAIPHDVDMVDVFRQSRFLPGIVSQAVSIGARTLWTQLDVVDLEAAATAESAGMEVVMDRCPAIELPRLRTAGMLPA
jgi:predicted CoA-binding protein